MVFVAAAGAGRRCTTDSGGASPGLGSGYTREQAARAALADSHYCWSSVDSTPSRRRRSRTDRTIGQHGELEFEFARIMKSEGCKGVNIVLHTAGFAFMLYLRRRCWRPLRAATGVRPRTRVRVRWAASGAGSRTLQGKADLRLTDSGGPAGARLHRRRTTAIHRWNGPCRRAHGGAIRRWCRTLGHQQRPAKENRGRVPTASPETGRTWTLRCEERRNYSGAADVGGFSGLNQEPGADRQGGAGSTLSWRRPTRDSSSRIRRVLTPEQWKRLQETSHAGRRSTSARPAAEDASGVMSPQTAPSGHGSETRCRRRAVTGGRGLQARVGSG